MATLLKTKHSIAIHAPAAKVWDALTKPDQIKQWFFGVNTETNWKVGSPIVHKGEYQGKPYEDKGEILAFEPQKELAYTHWSSMSGLLDQPENYQHVSYTLSSKGDTTEVTISESNLPSEEARDLSDKSWKSVLESLKKLLEK
jgi:uncharacterized protein YndB with AHSA1/START domain